MYVAIHTKGMALASHQQKGKNKQKKQQPKNNPTNTSSVNSSHL